MAKELISIFPTTILLKELGREFTAEEIKLFRESDNENEYSYNSGNRSSKDTYILDKLPKLKEFFQIGFEEYWTEVYRHSLDNAKPRITQSWLNWTKDGEYHHLHRHQNSYLSAVLYIETGKEDSVYFYKEGGYDGWDIEKEEFTWENAVTYCQQVKKGILCIFPSIIQHEVGMRELNDNITRISLAANCYPSGKIGHNLRATELYL